MDQFEGSGKAGELIQVCATDFFSVVATIRSTNAITHFARWQFQLARAVFRGRVLDLVVVRVPFGVGTYASSRHCVDAGLGFVFDFRIGLVGDALALFAF